PTPNPDHCTLTPGYWKTHSIYGPAPYDATWALVGEDSLFFDTGQSWYEVMWTPPAGGNAYYILAHHYIAAVLNELNGAPTAAVAAELAHAAFLLDQYDGSPDPMSDITGSVREDFIATAAVLDDYNNGIIGPGHCDDVPNIESSVYDAPTYGGNGNGVIDLSEVLHAISDYFDEPPVLTLEEVLSVLSYYFSQTGWSSQQ
ncbi:MAG: hypothetical protein ACE5IE_02645, partial [Dehalococcoidia bacterium]